MRILVLSDLHLDVWEPMPLRLDLGASRPDVVVLAGDIHQGARAVRWAEATFPGLPTLYVSGNHEAYCARIDEVERSIEAACRKSPSVQFLQERAVVLGGVRFLGCTLWTDFCLFGDARHAEAMALAQRTMADYRLIRLGSQGGRTIQPADTAGWHRRQLSWLAQELAAGFSGPTVVITHMAPSPLSIAPRYRDDLLSAAFASHLDRVVERADVWIHGHTHDSSDYRIGACHVVCNPRGYPRRDGSPENREFDAQRVISL